MVLLNQPILLTLLAAEVIIPWHFWAAKPISDTGSLKQSGLQTEQHLQ